MIQTRGERKKKNKKKNKRTSRHLNAHNRGPILVYEEGGFNIVERCYTVVFVS